MAFSPITTWQIEVEKVKIVTDFLFLGSKITADGDCSHEIRRRLLLGSKAMTNLDSVLKSRDRTLPTKVHIVKAMVFPVVTYGWELDHKEGRAPKNWCLQTVVLKVPWTARRSNQSILREGIFNLEYLLAGLMLKLKLQYVGHLIWTDDSLKKSLMLGRLRAEGEEGVRGWDAWMASLM